MAEAVSDGELQAVKPPPKRRRILDPSAIVPVPVYSSKVSSSLQLKPMATTFMEKQNADERADDESLWSRFSSRGPTVVLPTTTTTTTTTLSDSEEEEVGHVEQKTETDSIGCPSPPPPESPVQKQSRRFRQKISEFDRKLREVNSLLSPEPQDRRARRRPGRSGRPGRPSPDDDEIIITSPNDDVIITSPNDDVIIMNPNDDVIITSPNPALPDSPYSSSVREIPLKIRCRTDVHKIPVLSSTPLSDVLTQLSVILAVPPPRLLLLREEEELPTHSTVSELGLGIADIIECVVMAAEDKGDATGDGRNDITVRLQSKDRDASQEFSLHRDAPLGSIFSQYLSRLPPVAQTKVRFHFDGSKVTDRQTPAQLDMEDGDIIEVWI
ncbi:NFATC2-interacting protein [Dicentrarchus labrax]|uniref:NFATC2-interacting protein n=1 Tax=Dicentrarchus labrax TaxID=13489 RepID=UPI0021F5B3B9|nr:NFATC2-interacting protein [Dicentrarchus labrax]